MIHAFLFITKKKRDHSDHGPSFQTVMNAINSSSVTDHQRPSGGYNITIYHSFHEEVDSYKVHQWICESCGDLIKRAMNRKPAASDCIQHIGHSRACGNSSCHWHNHRMSCDGTYAKIAEPSGYMDKRRGSKGMQKVTDNKSKKSNVAIQGNRGSDNSKGTKEKPGFTRSNAITKFFHIEGGPETNLDSGPYSKSTVEYGKLKGTWLKSNSLSVALETQEQVKRPVSGKQKRSSSSIKKPPLSENEFTVISAWLEYYANEETDEDAEPLINKRTEIRKRQKMLRDAERPFALTYHRNSGRRTLKYLTTEHVSSIDHVDTAAADISDQSASLQLVSWSGLLPLSSPIQDNVIDISDDSS